METKKVDELSENSKIDDSTEKSYVNFEEWRDDTIKFYNEICVNLQDSETNIFEEEIKKAPGCFVQLTKKFCNCDIDCVAKSFNSLQFDTTCYLYDLDNIFLSTEYINCDFLNEKVADANLIDFKNEFSMKSFVDIYILISELCDNKPNSLQKLQCLMYNYKDGCKDKNLCSGLELIKLANQTCINEDFDEQIRDIVRSVHLNTDNGELVRSVRSNSPLSLWDSTFIKPLVIGNTQVSKSNTLTPISVAGIIILAISAISLTNIFSSNSSVKRKISVGLCSLIVILMCLCNLKD